MTPGDAPAGHLPAGAAPRVAVVGVHGHGTTHVRTVTGLHHTGQARFAAVADPQLPPSGGSAVSGPATGRVTRVEELPAGTAVYSDLDSLLAATEVDVVVICTPIHTHVPLAEKALRAGADVLLEKPPAASLAEFERLQQVVEETGRSCQVGFQVHGSRAARTLASWVADGRLGELRGIGAVGAWVRTDEYWQRARWAGRRSLDGIPVVDGAVTNPFAHASATALLVDGSGTAAQVASVETDLYRANPIEADDTSAVRIRTTRGTTILAALTLCAEPPGAEPAIIVHGSRGRAVLRYPSDHLELTVDGVTTATQYERDDLLVNLLDHRADPSVPLLAPLAELGGFTRVLEEVRLSPPQEIAPALIDWQGDGPGRHPVVAEVGKWAAQAAENLSLFSELGAPWATTNERRSAY
ncbi:oxidoreductase domain protein [Kribbella flavida DSM 17836]|uniref:Oxidoreductase domain protein n=1 Tax=Kribbella flavida (strain DSM 17836 / JCM 10339 / NBRC 14399) TaxID=479435 RepID=D2PWX4_KRIFD|nr:Gfo/Idh/MocA family oxidoreductase [Kribbella flavida]ADB35354.1 oxidoreductase domain protein [Kribbella flavida DSM 17836]